jgi:6-phosphogluconolactonase
MINISLRRPFSRRQLLQSAAALAVAHTVPGVAFGSAGILNADRILAYVGTYTGAIGAGSNGEGIYRFEMDVHTGELSHRKLVAKTPNPSWIAIHPSHRFLYAVNEGTDFSGSCGSVSAFAIVPETGDLRALNTVSSEGAGPAYLSIDATGTYAFVANYSGGSIAVLPLLPDGSLGAAVGIRRDSGSVGSTQATHTSPGSFAVSGHDAPHVHMIAPDPQNQFVLATDLGQDRIYLYRFNAGTGKLLPPTGAPFVALPSGDGPRHFAFHPNGHWLYAIQEEASDLVFFRYDPATGSLAAQQTISTLPPGFAGSSFASEVLLSPNGRFLYAANRLHDTIAAFAIDGDGSLKFIGETSTMGDYPGQCRIDPSGRFFYACNRRSDSITSFRIQADTGLLTFTGQYTPVGSPGSITFLT